jgi:hypothetical protein
MVIVLMLEFLIHQSNNHNTMKVVVSFFSKRMRMIVVVVVILNDFFIHQNENEKTVSNDEIHSIVQFKQVDQDYNQIEMKISPISPTRIIKVVFIFHQFSLSLFTTQKIKQFENPKNTDQIRR